MKQESYIFHFKQGIKPDPYINLVDWSNKYRYLPKESSVEPGQYRTSRTPYVEEILMELSPQSPTQTIVVIKPTQAGFALDLKTKIPIHDGWVTMGDISVGDQVYDEKGKVCNVNFTSEIFINHECRKVLFSDGSVIICDKDHKWAVIDTRNYKLLKEKVLSTQKIMETIHECYSKSKMKRNRYAISVAGSIVTNQKKFLISPYVLGCWIGDGSNASSIITQSKEDSEELCQHIKESGHYAEVRYEKYNKGNVATIHIEPKDTLFCKRGHSYLDDGQYKSGACKKCNRQRYLYGRYKIPTDPIIHKHVFFSKLKELNLLKNKHIPKKYLRGSYNQRLELLQGLMDTDGSITKDGRQEFCQSDLKIAKSVYELIVSLGLKASIKERPAQKHVKMAHGGYSDIKKQYRIYFYAQSDKPVFKLKRKLHRMKKPSEIKRPFEVKRRRIISVTPVDSTPVRCISVDSKSNLFLCGKSMIPTHNTELANNFLFCVAHLYPGPCLMAQPTDDMMKKHSKKKIAPSVASMPCLTGIIKKVRSRTSGNTLLLKEFPGGSWTFTGSNSPASARSDSIRYLVLDDLDGFAQDAGDEGAPHDLLKKRTDAFGSKKKIYINSTPTVAGISHIEKEFDESSQGLFYVPCPHCGEMQFLEFGGIGFEYGIKFKRDHDGQIIDTWYKCKFCKKRIDEWQKTEMMAKGEYVHKFPERKKRGFKINSLYSPLGWLSWQQVAEEFIKAAAALKKGNSLPMKVWVNTRAAEPYEEDGEQPEWTNLMTRAEPYKILTIPQGGCILCAGVDTQDNRLEFLLKAYGKDEENWTIYQTALYGDPDLPDVWEQLDDLLNRSYKHASGAELHILSMGIDTGGHKTQAVYNYCRKRGPKVFALKGSSSLGKPILNRPSSQDVDFLGHKIPNGVELWNIGVDTAKGTIYNRLKILEHGPGFYHFPMGLDEEFYRQLTAEKLVKKFIDGYPRYRWIKTRERNDVLDCDVYCLAAAYKAGIVRIDFEKLESNLSVLSEKVTVKKQKRRQKRKPQQQQGGYQRPSWMN